MKSKELEDKLNSIKYLCKIGNTHKYDEIIEKFSSLIDAVKEGEEKLEEIKKDRCNEQ